MDISDVGFLPKNSVSYSKFVYARTEGRGNTNVDRYEQARKLKITENVRTSFMDGISLVKFNEFYTKNMVSTKQVTYLKNDWYH